MLCQSLNAEFASKYNLDFDLLSDIDRDVVEAYDAKFVGLGGIDGYTSANRVVIIVDKEGIIRHRWVAENPGVEPDYDEIVSCHDLIVDVVSLNVFKHFYC